MSEIKTYTGRMICPLTIEEKDIDILDIAHSLSMQCRFTGHCNKFYSVAEHSVLVFEACDMSPYALLHDASEAYLTDIPSPLKPFFLGYKALEIDVQNTILSRYNLLDYDYHTGLLVKYWDKIAVLAEGITLFDDGIKNWNEELQDFYQDNKENVIKFAERINCLDPKDAKDLFLHCAGALEIYD